MTKGTETWSFEYDANGMRTKRACGDKVYTYVYSGSQLTAMTCSWDKFLFTYDAAGKPLTLEYHDTFYCQAHNGGACGSNCETYYYVTNLQGDVIALLDSSGNVKAEYAYDAWGNHVETPSSFIGNYNPLRYRGYVYDRETGLYYLQSRYYNPEIGRFINADAYISTGQGILGNNMFAYCGNNPVNRIDPTGENFVDWLKDTWNGVCDFFVEAYEFVTNSDAATTQKNLDNYGISFYNGTLVLSAALLFDRSAFSFGIIVMDDYYEDVSTPFFSTILNHEYGHTRHFRQVGLHTYASTVVVPSLIGAGLSYVSPWVKTNYESLPWERVAEHLGDVNGTYLPGSNTAGSIFWIYTLIYSFVTPF